MNTGTRDAKKDAVTLFDAIQIVKAFRTTIDVQGGDAGTGLSVELATTQRTLEQLLVHTERASR